MSVITETKDFDYVIQTEEGFFWGVQFFRSGTKYEIYLTYIKGKIKSAKHYLVNKIINPKKPEENIPLHPHYIVKGVQLDVGEKKPTSRIAYLFRKE